jgi:hypothetical protein
VWSLFSFFQEKKKDSTPPDFFFSCKKEKRRLHTACTGSGWIRGVPHAFPEVLH